MLSLAHSQKMSLVTDGYAIIPGAVAPIQIDATLKAINHWLGKGMPPEKVNEYWKLSFCPELRDQPLITDLMNHGCVHELTESVIGVGKVGPVPEGQIALRFPTFSDDKADSPGHIDGMYPPSPANPDGVLNNFTAVVGIQLSDMSRPGMGNLSVWPGSHRKAAAHLRDAGPQSLYMGIPKIDYGEPIQITANAGDMIIMHYLLVHGVTHNHAPHTRYALYYRPKHENHDRESKESMTDLWRHWEGLAEEVKLADSLPPAAARAVTTPTPTVPAMATPLVGLPPTPPHLQGSTFRPEPKALVIGGRPRGNWLKRKLRAIAKA